MVQHPDPEEGWENLIAIALITLLAVGVGWWVYSEATAEPVIDNTRVDVSLGASPSVGLVTAPVTVVMFSDFQCPYCGQFARESFPVIKKELIDTGKIRVVFKQFPLSTHEYAQGAAVASYCAQEQDHFWEYHDVLFANQEALDTAELERYAQGLGLDREQFLNCLNTSLPAVLRDKTQGEQLGVSGTPTFFFNGRKVTGALSPEDFIAEVQREG